MPTDLERFRDHARAMADYTDPRDVSRYMSLHCSGFRNPLQEPAHQDCHVRDCRCVCHPRETVTPTDVALWLRLADEIDDYLTPTDADHPTLEGV